ncbi:MAG TPA: hypothetical protein VFE47_26420 [Tepidisphaeraceae bacterium]|jgi:cytochrome c oxidase subunit 3|nr:hypothetical protein [Tepidisphaeraceae bacterium]
MSNAAITPGGAIAVDPHDAHAGNHHDPHLAHHFDTPEQQYISAKLGMWIFLGTEILMFGGLFCAYAVYRHNHQEVFEYAHRALDKWLGAINTLVLITSSLTMAWAVRSSQLGNQTSLRWLMVVTIIGGYVFLGIKSVEYHTKWHHELFLGSTNKFYKSPGQSLADVARSEEKEEAEVAASQKGHYAVAGATNEQPASEAKTAENGSAAKAPSAVEKAVIDPVSDAPPDPNRFTGNGSDAAQIHPGFADPAGLAPAETEKHKQELELKDLNSREQHQIYTFFAVYFVMTGLHGIHVVIGMSLIIWVLLRSLGPKNVAWALPLVPASVGVFVAVVGIIIGGEVGMKLIVGGLILAVLCVIWAMIWAPMRRNRSGESEFGPTYFTPVDLVGLYWHLVDMIWIFLFPMLYLIH